jgi:hypothetical protein
MDRRNVLKSSAAALGSALLAEDAPGQALQNVNTNSTPSQLKITDLRVAVVVKAPFTCPIIRIDTNQGVYGLGEVRDGASPTYALMLKSRLLGENPCQVDRLFRKIKQFGGPARQAGGVCGIEMALWDIAGKVWGVPAYQMLGGKFRDRIRIYADTTESRDPLVYAKRMKARKEEIGLTWLKMDLGIDLVADKPGTVTRPANMSREEETFLPHPFVATEVTDKGIELMSEFVAAVRETVGMEIPLSMDHLGHIGVTSCIRLGRAFEKFNLSWMELVEANHRFDSHPHFDRRGHLFEGRFHQALLPARDQKDSSRPCIIWRHFGNEENRRRRNGIWRPHGHALCGLARELYGQRSLRRSYAEFPGP